VNEHAELGLSPPGDSLLMARGRDWRRDWRGRHGCSWPAGEQRAGDKRLEVVTPRWVELVQATLVLEWEMWHAVDLLSLL